MATQQYNFLNERVLADPVTGTVSQVTPQQSVRDLQFASGDPASILRSSADQSNLLASNVPDPYSSILNTLKQYQQYGRQQVNAGQREQVLRASAALPSDLAGSQLSPSQILSFRRGEAGAVEPTIGGARSLVAETGNTINDLKDYFNTVQVQEAKARDDARNIIQNELANFGSNAFANDNPEEVKALLKKAGYPTDYIDHRKGFLSLKEQENKSNDITYTIQDVGGRTKRFGFDKQGKIVSTVDLGSSINSVGGGGGGGKITEKGEFLNNAESLLTRGKGEDGFVNPNLYRDLRSEFRKKFGDAQDFENEFPIFRYIAEPNRLGDLQIKDTFDPLQQIFQQAAIKAAFNNNP